MIIFLDMERTGFEDSDKICSIGILNIGDTSTCNYDLVDEKKKIKAKASSINNITNEMLKGKPSLIESSSFQILQEHNNQETTIIGHNISSDLAKLRESGFIFEGSIIDTSRVSKHLIEECESYSLGYLRYELKLYRDDEKNLTLFNIQTPIIAHHALSDSITVKELYEYHLESASKDEMCDLSFKKVLMQKLPFGKYDGRYIEDIATNDRKYLEWMLGNIKDLDEDLKYSIEKFID